jgi:hypothetical protein
MAPKVVFADIQAYLQAIADNPNNAGDVDQSNHQRFWNVPYLDFISKSVPGENCNNQPIPIVGRTPNSPNVDPTKCPFYQALISPTGWCNKGQMPKHGPPNAFITDPGYVIAVKKADGSSVSMKGQEIRDEIEWWLTHGIPEK